MHNTDEIAERLRRELNFSEGTARAYARTRGRCEYCDRDLIEDRLGYACGVIDHLLPKSTYPDLEWCQDNLVLACSLCNDVKRAHDVLKKSEKPEEALTQTRDALITRAREHILDRRKVVDPDWEKAKRIICSSPQS